MPKAENETNDAKPSLAIDFCGIHCENPFSLPLLPYAPTTTWWRVPEKKATAKKAAPKKATDSKASAKAAPKAEEAKAAKPATKKATKKSATPKAE